jgi:hypothetical protein
LATYDDGILNAVETPIFSNKPDIGDPATNAVSLLQTLCITDHWQG